MEYKELDEGSYLLIYDNNPFQPSIEIFKTKERALKFRAALQERCNVKRVRIFTFQEIDSYETISFNPK